MLGPLEHHVLEQVGDADLIWRLVARACRERDRDGRGKPAGHRYLDQRHAVGQDRLRSAPLRTTRQAVRTRPLGSAARNSTIGVWGRFMANADRGVRRQMDDMQRNDELSSELGRLRSSWGRRVRRAVRHARAGRRKGRRGPGRLPVHGERQQRGAGAAHRSVATRRGGARGLAHRARAAHRLPRAARLCASRARCSQQPLRVSGDAAAGHRDRTAPAGAPADRASRASELAGENHLSAGGDARPRRPSSSSARGSTAIGPTTARSSRTCA